MIFQNRHIGKEITVDLDVYFQYFVRSSSDTPEDEKQGIIMSTIQDRLKRMNKTVRDPFTAYYRRSSNDHVHMKLIFEHDVTVLDGFMIRAWLFDDQTRLSLDLARYLISGSLHEMNRCFDEKATTNGIKKAGPWIPIGQLPKNYCGEIAQDYSEYLKRFMGPGTRIFYKSEIEEKSKQADLGFV